MTTKVERSMELAAYETRFGHNIKRLREMRRWTQRDLARRMAETGLEIDRSTISKIESGTRPISLVHLVALKQVFGVSYDGFIPSSLDDVTDIATAALNRLVEEHAAKAAAADRARLLAAIFGDHLADFQDCDKANIHGADEI